MLMNSVDISLIRILLLLDIQKYIFHSQIKIYDRHNLRSIKRHIFSTVFYRGYPLAMGQTKVWSFHAIKIGKYVFAQPQTLQMDVFGRVTSFVRFIFLAIRFGKLIYRKFKRQINWFQIHHVAFFTEFRCFIFIPQLSKLTIAGRVKTF